MKSLEQIGKISFEELEAIAGDESVKAPESLQGKVDSAVAAAAVTGSERTWKRAAYISAVPTVLAAASLALFMIRTSTPVDTFEDPALAYAEVEKTFAYISSRVGRGIEIASEAEPVFEMTNETLERLNK